MSEYLVNERPPPGPRRVTATMSEVHLGFEVQVRNVPGFMVIESVEENSWADDVGIEVNDVIWAVNGEDTRTMNLLELKAHCSKRPLTLVVDIQPGDSDAFCSGLYRLPKQSVSSGERTVVSAKATTKANPAASSSSSAAAAAVVPETQLARAVRQKRISRQQRLRHDQRPGHRTRQLRRLCHQKQSRGPLSGSERSRSWNLTMLMLLNSRSSR